MKTRIACIAAPLALAASPALAADMPDRAGMKTAVTYALPHAFDGFTSFCSANLSADGYVATNRTRLERRYMEAAEGSWLKARDVLMQMGRERSGGNGAMEALSGLPDENLRPFVDGMIATMVTRDLTPERCQDVEEVLALLDPLPVENLAGLIGFMLETGERDKAAKRRTGEADGAEAN